MPARSSRSSGADGRFRLALDVPLPAAQAWQRLWDVGAHTRAVPLTRVRGGLGEGRIVARTGLGPLGFDDPMVVVLQSPPTRHERGSARLVKVGPVIRGEVEAVVEPLSPGASRVLWEQQIGVAGVPRSAGALVAGVARVAYALALRRVLADDGGEPAGAAHRG